MLRVEHGTDGDLTRAAEAFAGAVQGTREWSAWQEAKMAFERDAEIARVLARYQELASRWRQAQALGRGLAGQEAMELAELQGKIQQNGLFSRQQEAGAALADMLQQLNRIISARLGIDFAANAMPRGGGCCG